MLSDKTTSGISYFATVGEGPITGMYKHNGEVLVVSDGKLYVLHDDGTSDSVGGENVPRPLS